MKQVVPSTGRDLVVSFNYDPTGKEWVECFDNAPLGWAVDPDAPANPEPVMIGSLPPAAADTAPILSPQWAQFTGGYLIIPDVVRMLPADFFAWLGTNNGATRQVRSSMKSNELNGAFHAWGGGAPAGETAGTESAPPESRLPEGAYAPGRGALPTPPARRAGDGRPGDGRPRAELRPGENPGEHRGEQPDEHRPGEHPEGHPVDPMRSSDLGDTGIGRRGSEAEHRGTDKAPAPKPSPARDERHSAR